MGNDFREKCFFYFVDVVIFEKPPKKHLPNLVDVFERQRESYLKLICQKRNYLQDQVKYFPYRKSFYLLIRIRPIS